MYVEGPGERILLSAVDRLLLTWATRAVANRHPEAEWISGSNAIEMVPLYSWRLAR